MNELQQIIRAEIGSHGAIPFRRFMELCLYHPEFGYYERDLSQVGRAGDFFTSVSVGPLFGRLLASFIAQRFREDNTCKHVIEAGAHDGRLARDVISALAEDHPDVVERVEYVILEPSAKRRAAQQAKLDSSAVDVSWHADFAALRTAASGSSLRGVICSNELLDAFPVQALIWNASRREWRERAVDVNADEFVWTELPAEDLGDLRDLPAELLDVLPEGFRHERSPAAEAWWREAAEGLGAGALIAFDYGGTLESLLMPGREKGGLRGYREHRHADDLLAEPGRQDLTANVNWTAVMQTGEAAGLRSAGLENQGLFLTRLLEREFNRAPDRWRLTPKQVRQFQTLTHPEQMGRKFQVLVQER